MTAPRGFQRADSLLNRTKALPVGATTVVAAAIDLQQNGTGSFVADVEFQLDAPLLTAAELPDTKTITYSVLASANADMSSPDVIHAAILTQTGDGVDGAAAATAKFTVTSETKRYISVKAVGVATVAASTKSLTLTPKF